MSLELEEIQPGWKVVAADGEELGTGLLGGELHAPRDTVAEVETGRVELKVTREQLS